MKCENCNNIHNGEYGSGRFCSSKCARGFSTKIKRTEINRKVSNTLKSKGFRPVKGFTQEYWANKRVEKPIKERIEKPKIDEDRRKMINLRISESIRKTMIEKRDQRIDVLSFDELKLSEKKIVVFREQSGKCAICGIFDWQGKKLSFHFHHKDRNKNNHSRKNVEFICPNCHTQTENYGNKNLTNEEKDRLVSKIRMTVLKKRNIEL